MGILWFVLFEAESPTALGVDAGHSSWRIAHVSDKDPPKIDPSSFFDEDDRGASASCISFHNATKRFNVSSIWTWKWSDLAAFDYVVGGHAELVCRQVFETCVLGLPIANRSYFRFRGHEWFAVSLLDRIEAANHSLAASIVVALPPELSALDRSLFVGTASALVPSLRFVDSARALGILLAAGNTSGEVVLADFSSMTLRLSRWSVSPGSARQLGAVHTSMDLDGHIARMLARKFKIELRGTRSWYRFTREVSAALQKLGVAFWTSFVYIDEDTNEEFPVEVTREDVSGMVEFSSDAVVELASSLSAHPTLIEILGGRAWLFTDALKRAYPGVNASTRLKVEGSVAMGAALMAANISADYSVAALEVDSLYDAAFAADGRMLFPGLVRDGATEVVLVNGSMQIALDMVECPAPTNVTVMVRGGIPLITEIPGACTRRAPMFANSANRVLALREVKKQRLFLHGLIDRRDRAKFEAKRLDRDGLSKALCSELDAALANAEGPFADLKPSELEKIVVRLERAVERGRKLSDPTPTPKPARPPALGL